MRDDSRRGPPFCGVVFNADSMYEKRQTSGEGIPGKSGLMADVIYKRCYFDWGGRCAYCDVALSRQKTGGAVKASIDHFIPLSKGGQNSRSNRVLSCYPCNLAKNDTDPRETNRWPHVEKRLAEIAASPLLSHGKLKRLVPELVKQITV